MKSVIRVGAMALIVVITANGWADSPNMIHYQGRLVFGTNLYSGPVNLVFRMYDAPTGGTLLHTSTNAATAVDGLYATAIGEHGVAGDLEAALTNSQVWLEVQVNGWTLTPRERVLAVPYAEAVRGLRLYPNGSLALNADRGSNVIDGSLNATIGGGGENQVQMNAQFATIGGGYQNQVQTNAQFATIGGGVQNRVQTNAQYATIGGGVWNQVQQDAWYSTIGGGGGNLVQLDAWYATIGGGHMNYVQLDADYTTISGGRWNVVQQNADYATIGGGILNQLQQDARYATIGGGVGNVVQPNAWYATIGGGMGNQVHPNALLATIGGGGDNQVQAQYATIGGGYLNVISNGAHFSTIPGGWENQIGPNAQYAFAAGFGAVANHQGAFVWADSSGTNVFSTAADSVTFRAAGGYRFFSSSDMTLGAQLAPNATAWSAISDREAKENIEPIEPERVLEGVKQMPLSAWNYKADPGQRRYIGPMAQDFHALFGLGDEKTINTLDADGVLFAAVQALARQNESLTRENEEIRRQNEALRNEIEAIKQYLGF